MSISKPLLSVFFCVLASCEKTDIASKDHESQIKDYEKQDVSGIATSCSIDYSLQTIPHRVHLQDARFMEAVSYFIHISKQLDDYTLDPAEKGLNLSVNIPDWAKDNPDWREKLPKVNLDMKEDTTLGSLLIEIARQGRMDVYVTDEAVVLSEADSNPFPNAKAPKAADVKIFYKYADDPLNKF